MTQRTFSPEDQLAFARLSGDYNPLHMDPVAARRLLFGKQIVHGLHALLWAVDRYFDATAPAIELVTLKASFRSGIGVGEKVRCRYDAAEENKLEIRLTIGGAPAAWARLTWQPRDRHRHPDLPAAPPEKPDCRARPLKELQTAAGALPLYLDRTLAKHLFPCLSKILPPDQLAVALATTRLVGMECPGLHSIFSGLELTYSPDTADQSTVAYRVVTCNPSLSLVLMRISSVGTEGKIKAFLRPEAQRQVTFSEVRCEVKPAEFANQRAMVVGGSRGLGEVAAKLLAAGGAEVFITYCSGEADARRVVGEIVSGGARASCSRLNVLDPPEGQQLKIAGGSKPMFLYYFATPFIFGSAKSKFSPRRFNTFCEYYISGFLRTVETITPQPGGLEKIFYPSTSAIDETPLDMGEYAAAKAAGENLCRFLQKAQPAVTVYYPRLPRLATDQTASLLPVVNQEPVPLLLTHLRRLRDL